MMETNIHLRAIKTFVKSSAYSCQIKNSSLLYSLRRHQNLSQIGRFQKCASFMVLATTRILTLMCTLFFSCGSANLNNEESEAVIKHLMAEIKLRQDVTPLNKA